MDLEEVFDGGAGAANRYLIQDLRFSNFLLTISSNITPHSDTEKDNLVDWFTDCCGELFDDWDEINGNVLKPAGTPNMNMVRFPDDSRIISVRAKVAIEAGAMQGQVHAHVLLEVAHNYTRQEDGAAGYGYDTGVEKRNLGVHVNVYALREWFNSRIPRMMLDVGTPTPEKVYVNSRLLTKGTDNSNKWLTLAYINKTRARDQPGLPPRNLPVDEAAAPPELQRVGDRLRGNATLENTEHAWPDGVGVGGALTPPDSPPAPQDDDSPPPSPPAPGFRRTTVSAPGFTRTTISAPKMIGTTKGGMRKFK